MQNVGVRQIYIRNLAPPLTRGKLLLTCICLHICKMGLIKASSRFNQCCVLHLEFSVNSGPWIWSCCILNCAAPGRVSATSPWSCPGLLYSCFMLLFCSEAACPILDGFVCHGRYPRAEHRLWAKTIPTVDSITTGPTGTPLCCLSSLRSPSHSGAQEPGDAFEPGTN